jgi:hypothetical protein
MLSRDVHSVRRLRVLPLHNLRILLVLPLQGRLRRRDRPSERIVLVLVEDLGTAVEREGELATGESPCRKVSMRRG